MYESDAIRV